MVLSSKDSPFYARYVAQRSAENRDAAKRDASALVAMLRLPPGASEAEAEPEGDGGQLHPSNGGPDTPNGVRTHRWWTLQMSSAKVFAYLKTHPPTGASRTLESGPLESAGMPHAGGQIWFEWAPVRGASTARLLMVTLAKLPGGATGMLAEADVVWETPRAETSRIPGGSRIMKVTQYAGMNHRSSPEPFTIRSPERIERVVALLNALPAAQPGVSSCPADEGTRVTLTFYRRPHTRPLATAQIAAGGCGGVALMVHHTEEGLQSGDVLRAIGRSLGAKLVGF
jgi:hypothetical protein